MNLIRAALFAVFAFMGTYSLSAQQNWLPPAQAAVVLENALIQLHEVPAPVPSAGLTTKQAILEQNAKSGCTDCLLKSVKSYFATNVMDLLKQGTDTGDAVEQVRATMITNANGNPTGLNAIQAAYEWMQQIL